MSKKIVLVGLIIMLAVLLVGGAGLYLFVSQKPAVVETPPPTPSPVPASAEKGLIVYVSNSHGENTSEAAGQQQIFTMSPDGSNKKQLTTEIVSFRAFAAWSRDRKKIAFTSAKETGTAEIWVINADGSNLKQLTFPPGSGNFVPSWSPDGTQIAFTSNRAGVNEIWIMNTDGSNQKQLTKTVASGIIDEGSNGPSWSPDGNQILYETAWKRSPKDPIETWVMDSSDGGNAHLLLPFTYGAGRLPWW